MQFTGLRELYDQGQTEKVLQEIASLNLVPGHAEYADLLTLKGWCHYRRKEYREAHDASVAGGSHRWARELMAYLLAYVPGYANDQGLRQIAEELGNENLNAVNALVIRARAPDCFELTHDDVALCVGRFRQSTAVSAANLFHNAGRFFLDKSRGDHDLRQAVSYLDHALPLYGQDTHWHHRAAAQHWKSVAVERLEGPQGAVPFMEESLRLWEAQVALDPTNRSFQEKCAAAQQRLAGLKS